jgi:hypothetical protein
MAKKKKEKKPKERPRILLLYVGVREGKNARLFHVYYQVTQEEYDAGLDADFIAGKESRWFSRRFGYARPGTILSIEATDDGHTVYRDTAKTLGYMPDDVCATWAAQSKTIETANKMEKQAKREGARDLSFERLEPLRLAYWKLRTSAERAAFLARVNVAVTSLKPLK